MILVDTSVWIDHLRHGNPTLARLLDAGHVLAHPFITGELALGNLRQRAVILETLQALPRASVATDAEVLAFIDRHKLMGLEIGYIDVHLLVAARLTPDAAVWTHDKRLLAAAQRLTLAADLPR